MFENYVMPVTFFFAGCHARNLKHPKYYHIFKRNATKSAIKKKGINHHLSSSLEWIKSYIDMLDFSIKPEIEELRREILINIFFDLILYIEYKLMEHNINY